MYKQKILLYGVIPIGSTLVMIGMYFSGIPILRDIIAPNIPDIYANSQRELGLLENLQNVVLICMFIITAMGIWRKPSLFEKVALAGIGCFTIFVLLEEMDYGLHYYEFLRGIKADDAVQVRNLHNVEGRTGIIKKTVDVAMVLLFFVLPFALHKVKNTYVQFLLPDRFSTVTLIGSFLMSTLAHALDDHGFAPNGVFHQNISEFREFMNYFIFMLYLRELVLKRDFHALPAPDNPESP